MHRTETGIYESYVMSDYKLKDDTVEDALVRMITLMRQGHQFELPSGDTVDSGPAPEDQRDLVIANILRNWRSYSEEYGLPRQDDVIGVLRTILHSLDIWRWKNMSAQGYLQFLEGFLKETSVSVQRISPEELEVLDEDIEDEEFEDED